jgi:hypothetical protein
MIVGGAWCQTINLESTNRPLTTNGSVIISSTATIKNCAIKAGQDVTLSGDVTIVNSKIECNVLHFNAASVTTRGTVTIVCNQLDLGPGTHEVKNSKLVRSKLIINATDINGTGTFNKHRRLAFIMTVK